VVHIHAANAYIGVMRSATSSELLELLRDRQDELRTRLNDPTVQLSMPVDDGTCRLRAMMKPDRDLMVIFEFDIGNERVMVPVELVDEQEPLRCQFVNQIRDAATAIVHEMVQREALETRLDGEIKRLERLLADAREQIAMLQSH